MKKIGFYNIADYTDPSPWLRKGYICTVNMLIGHKKEFNKLFNTESFLSKMKKENIGLFANNIQHYSTVPVG